MIFQDVRKNTMKLISNTKRIMIKKTKASKLKEQQKMYVLRPKADHQGSEIPFTDFRWIGLYIVEKVSPDNNYLVRKPGTNRTQFRHRRTLRLVPPRQPIPDVETTSQEWKHDSEVIRKHDDLWARALESEYETPIFDKGQHEPDNKNSPQVTVRHDLANDKTCNSPGTILMVPQKFSPT